MADGFKEDNRCLNKKQLAILKYHFSNKKKKKKT